MPGKKWTETDLETLALGYTLKTPIKQIALLVQREENAVMTKAHRLGLIWGIGEAKESDEPEIYKGTMKDHPYLEGGLCDWCPETLGKEWWGYGRWSHDTEECANTHLKYEQENGPCHADRTHQSHDGRDNKMVGMAAPVGREPVLISYAEDPMNKRPRRDVRHQKSTYEPIGHSDPDPLTECDCVAPNRCEKCVKEILL